MSLRTIGGRLYASFLVMVVLVIAVGVVGLVNISALNRASQQLGNQAQQVTRLRVIQAGVENTRLALTSALNTRSDGELTRAGIILTGVDDQITAYQSSSALPAGAPDMTELKTKRQTFDKMATDYMAAARQGTVFTTDNAASLDQASSDVRAALDKLVKDEQGTMDQVQASAAAAQSRALMLTIVIGAVAVIAAGIMAFTITRSITRPLAYLVNVSDRISTGELTAAVELNTKDEIAELGASLERMRVSLQAVIERLRGSR